MCVYGHMSKKSRVGRSALIFFIFFLLLAKPEIVVPGSGIRIRYFIFEISGKPSFVDIYILRQSINGDDYLSGAAQREQTNKL